MRLRAQHLFIAALLSGCSLAETDDWGDAPTLEDDGDDGGDDLDALPLQGGAPRAAGLEACPGSRLIAVLTDADDPCTLGGLPPGWGAERLFEDSTPGLAALHSTTSAPAALRAFCAYQWTDPDPAHAPTNGVLHNAMLGFDTGLADSLAPDCRGHVPQGTGLDVPVLDVELRAAFRASIDAVSGDELSASASVRERVDIAVPDTISLYAAADPTIIPVNDHGSRMATVIRGLSCPDGDIDCYASNAIRHTLALPREDWDSAPNYIEGGHHGTQGDLAAAIYESVGGWRQRRLADPNGTAPRMVVNLSVGFARALDGLDLESKGPARAMFAALRHASCQGALVVAAAGNKEDPACPESGPLAPGSAETEAAPTLQQCAQEGFAPLESPGFPVFGPPTAYRPLVHSIHGVDQYDQPLFNARDDARPRLAALGSDAIGGLTGSSTATAVVSGTAALLWSYRPELRSDQIMQLIYSAGQPLGGAQADFGIGGLPPQPVHRVSVCAALAAACDGRDPSQCPDLQCEAMPPEADGSLGDYFDAVDAVLATSPTETYSAATSGGPTCETTASDNLSAPQPDVPVCAHCNVTVDANAQSSGSSPTVKLNMTIDEEYYGLIESVRVVIEDDTEARWSYALDGDSISSLNRQGSPEVDVTSVTLEGIGSVRSAVLVFTLGTPEGTTTTSNEQITTKTSA